MCMSEIKMGGTIQTFSEQNEHICPEGFRLSWIKPEGKVLIDGFQCPPFVSYSEHILYDGITVTSDMKDGICSDGVSMNETACLEEVKGCSDSSFTSSNTCLEDRGVWTAECSNRWVKTKSACLSASANVWNSEYGYCVSIEDNTIQQGIDNEGWCLSIRATWTEECSIPGINNEADCTAPFNTWDTASVNTWTKYVNKYVYENSYCKYTYYYLLKAEESFYTLKNGGEAEMGSADVYLYCPLKCSIDDPCGVDQACVAGTCVYHTCDNNAQANGCSCYGEICNKWCMDNGECVDVIGETDSNNIISVIHAFNDVE